MKIKINHKKYKNSSMNAWIKYKEEKFKLFVTTFLECRIAVPYSPKKFQNKEIHVILEITF